MKRISLCVFTESYQISLVRELHHDMISSPVTKYTFDCLSYQHFKE